MAWEHIHYYVYNSCVYVYAYMYNAHIHTYTEILLDSKYTLREVHFLQLELLKSPV